MKLTYRDGRSGDDRLFDLTIDEQRAHVARCMDCDPRHPGGWPITLIDRLLNVRRHQGQPDFYRALGQIMSPDVC